MPFKDVLLHLPVYPDPAADELVDQAVTLCGALSRSVCAVAMPIHIPLKSNRIADALIGLAEMARDEEQKALESSRALLQRFHERAASLGLAASMTAPRSTLYEIGEHLMRLARTRDLCVFPMKDARDEAQRSAAETVAFQSGRPVVVFLPRPEGPPLKLDTVVIAWDGSRSAARAVADAMPILSTAAVVRILSVVGEKAEVAAGMAGELVRHLATHDVAAEVDEVDALGEPIGAVFRRHLATRPADLLVMGAFGHSRAREFVLGGATRSVLSDPPIPVLLSH